MIDSIAPNRKTRPESFFSGIMIIRGLKAHAITEWPTPYYFDTKNVLQLERVWYFQK